MASRGNKQCIGLDCKMTTVNDIHSYTTRNKLVYLQEIEVTIISTLDYLHFSVTFTIPALLERVSVVGNASLQKLSGSEQEQQGMAVLCGMPTIQYSLGYLCGCLSGCVQRWQVVKVIWHKAHRRRRRMVHRYSTGDRNVSSHKCTLAPPGEYDWIWASFCPLESTIQTANLSVKPFCTSHGKKCL